MATNLIRSVKHLHMNGIPTDNFYKFLTVLTISGCIVFFKLWYDSQNDYREKVYQVEKEKSEYISELLYYMALDSLYKFKGFSASNISYYYAYDGMKDSILGRFYFDSKGDSSIQVTIEKININNRHMAELKAKQIIADNYLTILTTSINRTNYLVVLALFLLLLFFVFSYKWYQLDMGKT